jgi:nucleotide-binding universal stress UspA family protein
MYKKIIVPIDGSPTAQRALDEAVRLASALGSGLELIFVVDNSDMLYSVGYYDPASLRQDQVAFGHKTLGAAVPGLQAAGIAHATHVIEEPIGLGDVSGTILDCAKRFGADLIVLGTHGRRGVRRLVMGSVAEGVIRQATVPVLLIHADSPDWG